MLKSKSISNKLSHDIKDANNSFEIGDTNSSERDTIINNISQRVYDALDGYKYNSFLISGVHNIYKYIYEVDVICEEIFDRFLPEYYSSSEAVHDYYPTEIVSFIIGEFYYRVYIKINGVSVEDFISATNPYIKLYSPGISG
jgi:hypothetical protein